ncbi:MAG: hypothetical protein EBR30_19740 [Cytophagia bacterium]|nr:hypothetical protein [Cytophagia bacterium]
MTKLSLLFLTLIFINCSNRPTDKLSSESLLIADSLDNELRETVINHIMGNTKVNSDSIPNFITNDSTFVFTTDKPGVIVVLAQYKTSNSMKYGIFGVSNPEFANNQSYLMINDDAISYIADSVTIQDDKLLIYARTLEKEDTLIYEVSLDFLSVKNNKFGWDFKYLNSNSRTPK